MTPTQSPEISRVAATDGHVSAQHWKWSALAGMASYLDAGSIVALGAGLALFQREFGLDDTALGTLAAIGPNAIGCALGSSAAGATELRERLGQIRDALLAAAREG